ncbi:MAG: hypothetical protein KKI08_14500, partial [Armatimonadetes bacterium]|nr:hypothetical protein [Armatimonadota bacterium]
MDQSAELSPQDSLMLQVLELVEEGSRAARSRREDRAQVMAFYDAKDEVMRVFHGLLGGSSRLAYCRVPFVTRCLACKQKADALHALDASHSWE